jgi:hypothetical protein
MTTMLRSTMFATFALATVAGAQQPTLQAAPSTRATTVVSLTAPRGSTGLTPGKITINYGQPFLRGRPLATLAPNGSRWRLGANEATSIETDVDLVIGGLTVPKGKYTLSALPDAAGWKLIINKQTGQWGTAYDAAQDLGRVDLRMRTLTSPVDAFTMWLVPSTQPGAPRGELRFAWGDVELSTDWSLRTP